MFEVKCVADGRRLADVLRALKGLTLEQPIVNPIDEMPRNEAYHQSKATKPVVSNGHALPKVRKVHKKRRQQIKTEGKAHGLIRDYIEQNSHLTEISPAQMRRVIEDRGYARGSHSYALNKLLNEGVLTNKGFGIYGISGRGN